MAAYAVFVCVRDRMCPMYVHRNGDYVGDECVQSYCTMSKAVRIIARDIKAVMPVA